MQRRPDMSPRVISTIRINTEDHALIRSIATSLRPDNEVLPRDMKISDDIRMSGESSEYSVYLEVDGEIKHCLKRTRATINEILSIVKTQIELLESIGV